MNSNTFYFPKYYFLKFVILYFFLNNFIIPIVFYFGDELDTIIFIVIPLSAIAQLIVSCVVFIEYYIVLEPTSLTIIDKAICRKKRKSYFYTELEKIELINQTTFYLVKKNGEKEKIFSFEKEQIEEEFKEENEDNENGVRKIFYDYAKKRREIKIQGINYFLNYVNFYIKGYS